MSSRYSKLLHIALKLLTWRVIILTAFRPTGLYPIAMMDISQRRQSEPMRCSQWSPVVARTDQRQINLEYSYQGDHSPDTSLKLSQLNHSSFPLKPATNAVGMTSALMWQANESTHTST